MDLDHLRLSAVDAALTTALGLLLFVLVLALLDRALPFSLKKALSGERNPAVAVILLSILIGLGFIVSAAAKGA
jgi:uncharacterized membrane protein YjfL (UPF0719 family)